MLESCVCNAKGCDHPRATVATTHLFRLQAVEQTFFLPIQSTPYHQDPRSILPLTVP